MTRLMRDALLALAWLVGRRRLGRWIGGGVPRVNGG